MNTAVAKKTEQSSAKADETKVVSLKKEVNPTEAKIQHIINVGQKIKRRSEIAKSKADLESFILSAENGTASLEFEDTKRRTFTSNDAALMVRIQKTIIASCEEEIELLNSQINSFTC